MKGIALDIELSVGPVLHQRRDFVHVIGANVPLIGPWMHRDALGTGLQAQLGGARHARNVEVPGVAQQGNLVDIDRQGRFVKRFTGGLGG